MAIVQSRSGGAIAWRILKYALLGAGVVIMVVPFIDMFLGALVPGPGRGRLETGLVHVGEHEASPARGEAQGDGPAEAAGGTGHDRTRARGELHAPVIPLRGRKGGA